jgi:hypothetical protein
VHLREVLLGMRIPSKRKPKRDIDLETECVHKLKFSRESVSFVVPRIEFIFFFVCLFDYGNIKEKDHMTLYEILCSVIGEENVRKDQHSREALLRSLESLFDRVIQEEKYPCYKSKTKNQKQKSQLIFVFFF